jgi:LEA14-like dessication related protein
VIASVALAAVTTFGCQRPAKPEFVALDNVELKGAKLDGTVVLTADAVFRNPNRFGVNVTGLDLDVFIDDRQAAAVRQDVSVEAAASAEFSLPVEIEVKIDKVYADLGELIGGLLSKEKRDVVVRLDGRILVEAVGMELAVPFRHEESHELDI